MCKFCLEFWWHFCYFRSTDIAYVRKIRNWPFLGIWPHFATSAVLYMYIGLARYDQTHFCHKIFMIFSSETIFGKIPMRLIFFSKLTFNIFFRQAKTKCLTLFTFCLDVNVKYVFYWHTHTNYSFNCNFFFFCG